MRQITTHILNTAIGKPASEVVVRLHYRQDGNWVLLAEALTDADGRIQSWLALDHILAAGIYRLDFAVGDYFKVRNEACFFPEVNIQFQVESTGQRYHVPLLLNPFGYSTYRGS